MNQQANQVSVELRLLLDKFRKDLKTAASEIKGAFGGTGQADAAPAIEKATKAMDSLNTKTKQVTQSLKEQRAEAYRAAVAAVDAFRAAREKAWIDHRSRNLPPGARHKFSPEEQAERQALANHLRSQRAQARMAFSGGGIASSSYMGPIPPVIPPPAGGGGNIIPGVNNVILAFGAVGAGLAGLRVAIGYVRFAFQGLLRPLQMVARAADQASHLYAKALQNGAGMRYTAAADAFSSVLGVSEADVFKYAESIEYLNKRMGSAIEIVAKTTPDLTSLSWEFKALQYNLRASFSLLGQAAAQDLRQFTNAITRLVQVLNLAMPHIWRWIKTIGLQQLPVAAWASAQFAKLLGDPGAAARMPQAHAHRLQGSSWERMGLVLGPQTANYAQQTANNTRRMASLMERLFLGQDRLKMSNGTPFNASVNRA